MFQRFVRSLAVLALLVGTSVAQDAPAPPEKTEKIEVGGKAPDFTVTGIDGKPIKLSEKLKSEKNLVICFSRAFW